MQWPFARKTTSGDWLAERVAYFRTLGFFSSDAALTDQQVAEKAREAHRMNYEEEIEPEDPIADLKLVKYDASRVWWRDMEAGIFSSSREYERIFAEWGKISRGAFQPMEIRETWESEQGPIQVAFLLNGRPQEVHPAYSGDYIDPGVLKQINAIIRATGIEFAQYDPFDQNAVILALTADEKRRLAKDRRWMFAF